MENLEFQKPGKKREENFIKESKENEEIDSED